MPDTKYIFISYFWRMRGRDDNLRIISTVTEKSIVEWIKGVSQYKDKEEYQVVTWKEISKEEYDELYDLVN
jgi:hypothetical protein